MFLNLAIIAAFNSILLVVVNLPIYSELYPKLEQAVENDMGSFNYIP